ncbi:single-stranded-DNA-specific exonuclease RecJ [Helicobacter burdigaliensis]|uniref:single-stranded-DNA-specific exonuclease RecJ n=1 Tax=Helicobacter burdigaliensis TaxID=2315334 RepID=UPI000EF73C4C|nr:single-stranded-DNA-specific exonuclease RecJ [Helicobacter burdigaliensis]
MQKDNLKSLNKEEILEILKSRFANEKIQTLKDLPKPNTLDNLEQMAQKIHKAILENKKIVILGDYDVDGVVSCAIVSEFFALIPYEISIVIPNRFSDGYGISEKIVERLECDMIITVDNGISALSAASLCKARGIELLITDHHTPKDELPDALIVNPKLSPNFPQKEICGANVAWYLCAALKQQMGLNIDLSQFLDFLSLAIISDVMPLSGINRVLFKKGLEVFKNTKRLSLQVLKENFRNYSLNAETYAFYLSPLLNCAGRMRDAKEAYDFLAQKDSTKIYENLFSLVELNKERKAMQEEIYKKASEYFSDEVHLPFVCLYDPFWHEGVLGIVSARMCEEFLKPAIILTKSDGVLKGSMRAPYGVDCVGILETCKEYLKGYGGHSGAAGLSLEVKDFMDFKNALMQVPYQIEIKQNEVMGRLHLREVSRGLWSILEDFEPFGEGNPKPKFLIEARLKSVRYFGEGNLHSSLVLEEEGETCKGIMFFNVIKEEFLGKNIECIASLSWDNFNKEPSLRIEKIEMKI